MEIPALLVYGDSDSIPPSHAAQFYSLLGGGQRDAAGTAACPPRPGSRSRRAGPTTTCSDGPALPATIAEFSQDPS